MASILNSGMPVRGGEEDVERPDGSFIWSEGPVWPREDGNPDPSGTPTLSEVQELLREREKRLIATYEHAGTGITEVDSDGRLLRINAQLCELMGYTQEELLGRSIFDEMLTDDAAFDRDQFRRQVAGEIDGYSLEKRIKRKSGGFFWSAITSSSVRDQMGKFLYAVRVQHDITDRKLAEQALARRIEEQAALYELAERLQHAETLTDIYNAALDAIQRALNCRRASILLFDDTDVMKFVAWRGLSPGYRNAVEGHSPWMRDAKAPQPIWIEDIARADFDDALKALISGEGIAALAFIPILQGGRLLGKFMTYYDAPHQFHDAEIGLAATIARHVGFGVDRMRAEEARQHVQRALRESEIRKTAILESALDAIITMDEDGRIIDFNPMAERLFGYLSREVIGKKVVDTIVPAHLRDAYTADLKAFIEGDKSAVVGHRLEVPAMRSNGREFEAELAVSASTLENGRILFTGYVRDITERKHAERAAQRLVAIVESSDDAIISKDLNGIIRTWNRGAERLFGYRADEAIGRPITMLIPPDRQNEEPSILERIRRGEHTEHYETVRRRKDGSLVDISLTVSPIRDGYGKIFGASKIAHDISERKASEAKLRDSEYRLQELLAAIPAAIYTTDAAGKITYFNEAAVALAGRTPTLGSDEWCVTWKLYRPDGTPLPNDECPMVIALREGRPIRNVEAVAERPDGTRVPFIPHPTPLRDAHGNIVGGINMLIDISERKHAETQQIMLLNELNHRVKNNMQMLQSLLNAASRQAKSPEAKGILADAGSRIAAMAAAQRVLYGTLDATRFNADEFVNAVCHTAQQMFPDHVDIHCESDAEQLPNDSAMPLALILNELLTNAV
ncbi:MAG TPA: PAS domain S-box protein, partial [Xanthobacteraceae bacterium]|nr:PAS domain S-box protein [Xanthobacteraceae bacterium]